MLEQDKRLNIKDAMNGIASALSLMNENKNLKKIKKFIKEINKNFKKNNLEI